ncbi:TOBE domain-containing protein [Roseivirga misakiensis]|uniref:TOBE domain-containing protein n=1 Tax=Roseivirga misakiensis TaxID=1563681 RepID=UPI000B48A496|nr:TOBE domain-containing protein [Roseivirga misakiensis]
MNTLKAEISSINTKGSLSIVTLKAAGQVLTSMVIDTPETSDILKVGNVINALFKETEVIIGLSQEQALSVENKLNGTVLSLETDELLARVVIQIDTALISSITTTSALKKLNLAKGTAVFAMIKSNEIMLSAI